MRAAHSVWRWGSQLVSPRARFRVPLKGNGLLILGRILPGNTIAKTFHRWVQLGNSYSFWNSTRSSKNTTQGRKGRGREGGKKGEREGEQGLDSSCPFKGGERKLSWWGSLDVIGVCVCVCVFCL